MWGGSLQGGVPLLFPMTANRQLLQELGRGWFQSQCCPVGGASPQLCWLCLCWADLSAFPSSPGAELGIWAWVHPSHTLIGSGAGSPGLSMVLWYVGGFSLRHKVPPTSGASGAPADLAYNKEKGPHGKSLYWCGQGPGGLAGCVVSSQGSGAERGLSSPGKAPRRPLSLWLSRCQGHTAQAGPGPALPPPMQPPITAPNSDRSPCLPAPGWCPARPWLPCWWFTSPLCWPPRRKPSFPSSRTASSRGCR